MEGEAMNIIIEILSQKYPEFNSRFKDLIKKILDKVYIYVLSIVVACNLISILFWTVNYFISSLMTSTTWLEISIKL